MEFPHLSKAPITEALIDIQGFFGDSSDPKELLELFENCHKQFAESLPKKSQRFARKILLSQSNKNIQSVDTQLGFHFTDDQNKKVLQYRTNGFSMSHLPQYKNWDTLVKDARTYWKIYKNLRTDFVVNRLAVRYINAIEVPYPLINYEQYVKGIEVPPGLNSCNSIKSFTNQVLWSVDDPVANVNLIRALQKAKKDSSSTKVVVDIDVFRPILEIGSDSEEIWDILKTFGNLKNKVFFDTIGEKVMEKYL